VIAVQTMSAPPAWWPSLSPARRAVLAALTLFLDQADVLDPKQAGRVYALEALVAEHAGRDRRDRADRALRAILLRLRMFRAHWPHPPARDDPRFPGYADDLGLMLRDDLPRLRRTLMNAPKRATARQLRARAS
jgi:hypothetical protein